MTVSQQTLEDVLQKRLETCRKMCQVFNADYSERGMGYMLQGGGHEIIQQS